jgi:hypothetical protein
MRRFVASTFERLRKATVSHLHAALIEPNSFEAPTHYYPRTLNALIHPTVAYFFNTSIGRLIQRYCHMNPRVDPNALRAILTYQPRHFAWAGADLFHVTSAGGNRQMVIIETNSCPSGQKSMPLLDETKDDGGYRRLIESSFLPRVAARQKRLPKGALAVIYDKNPMENTGYAATIATCSKEPVYLAEYKLGDPDPSVRFREGLLEVRDGGGTWQPIRAAFRYITQKPWARLPVQTRTLLYNPTLACLAGGRNKMLAAKAYDMYNAELRRHGLAIRYPETFWDVGRREIPLWVKRLGGLAVVKNPYSNAGQGVYTITNQQELDAFMNSEQQYDQFIVQSLIGNYRWSSESQQGRFYHVGTMPNKREESFAADLRMMVCSTPQGFMPLAIYARRARKPLVDALPNGMSSWDILGTNLSVKQPDGSWTTQPERLLLMDRRDFNLLGIGVDDLVDGYVQTVLAAIAIDKLAQSLLTQRSTFRRKLFQSLNNDKALLDEVVVS